MHKTAKRDKNETISRIDFEKLLQKAVSTSPTLHKKPKKPAKAKSQTSSR